MMPKKFRASRASLEPPQCHLPSGPRASDSRIACAVVMAAGMPVLRSQSSAAGTIFCRKAYCSSVRTALRQPFRLL